MQNRLSLSLSVIVCIIYGVSCGQNGAKQVSGTELTSDGLSFIDSLEAGEPYKLCVQELTSSEAVSAAFSDDEDDYCNEATPAEFAFFYPEPDIVESDLVKNVRNKYNCVTVLNHVQHSYELFCRLSSSVDDSETTRTDTLEWLRMTRPGITPNMLGRVLTDERLENDTKGYLKAYFLYEGDPLDDESEMAAANRLLSRDLNELPSFVDTVQAGIFAETFWDWYDKDQFVPGIDEIIKMHLQDAEDVEISPERLEHFRNAILSEKDIDRRAILALEYAKFDGIDGASLLGEIIESGLYSRYLLEVWISWRAHVQMEHSVSSFCVIPNNYYDRMKVKCMNTILRDYQISGDFRNLLLLDNFIYTEILHRQASVFGNESVAVVMNLDYDMFIHPRLLETD